MTYTTCSHCGKIKKKMDVKSLVLKDVISQLAKAAKTFLKAENELQSLINKEPFLKRKDWSNGPIASLNAMKSARRSIADTALNVTRFIKNLKEGEISLEGRAKFETRSGIMRVSQGKRY